MGQRGVCALYFVPEATITEFADLSSSPLKFTLKYCYSRYVHTQVKSITHRYASKNNFYTSFFDDYIYSNKIRYPEHFSER